MASAIGSIIKGFASYLGSSGVTAFVVRAGITYAINKALMPDLPTIDQSRSENVVRGGSHPRMAVYGKQAVGGVLAYANTAGTNNRDLWFAIAHAGHECNDITD